MNEIIIKLEPGYVVKVDKDNVIINPGNNTAANNTRIVYYGNHKIEFHPAGTKVTPLNIDAIDMHERLAALEIEFAQYKKNTTAENSDVKRKPSRTTVVQCGKLIELD